MNKNIVTLGQKILISNPDASAAAEVLVPHRFEREAAFCQRQQEAEKKAAKLMAAPAPAAIDRDAGPGLLQRRLARPMARPAPKSGFCRRDGHRSTGSRGEHRAKACQVSVSCLGW